MDGQESRVCKAGVRVGVEVELGGDGDGEGGRRNVKVVRSMRVVRVVQRSFRMSFVLRGLWGFWL